MKRVTKIIGIILGVVILLFIFLWGNNDIGINKHFIEKEARKSSKIYDDWQVAIDTTDIMSAMVFYPEDKSDHSFQIYVNRSGLSFGYFFRGGGHIAELEDYITEFTIEGYKDSAYLSLNTQQVVKAEIDHGVTVEIIDIDSTKPFALVLPRDIDNIRFFDINDNVVDTMRYQI